MATQDARLSEDYVDFRERYLPRARNLARETADPDTTASRLCEEVFASLCQEDWADVRKVNLKLAECYYSRLAQDDTPISSRMAQRIYGSLNPAVHEKWISEEKCLAIVGRVLVDTRLFDRLCAALTLLGWENERIADLMNDTIDNMSQSSLSADTLVEVSGVLGTFRMRVLERIRALEENSEWLGQLIEHDKDPKMEFETWRLLRDLSGLHRAIRFARKRNPNGDRFGVLRDKWDSTKKRIREQLKPNTFLETKGPESACD